MAKVSERAKNLVKIFDKWATSASDEFKKEKIIEEPLLKILMDDLRIASSRDTLEFYIKVANVFKKEMVALDKVSQQYLEIIRDNDQEKSKKLDLCLAQLRDSIDYASDSVVKLKLKYVDALFNGRKGMYNGDSAQEKCGYFFENIYNQKDSEKNLYQKIYEEVKAKKKVDEKGFLLIHIKNFRKAIKGAGNPDYIEKLKNLKEKFEEQRNKPETDDIQKYVLDNILKSMKKFNIK